MKSEREENWMQSKASINLYNGLKNKDLSCIMENSTPLHILLFPSLHRGAFQTNLLLCL